MNTTRLRALIALLATLALSLALRRLRRRRATAPPTRATARARAPATRSSRTRTTTAIQLTIGSKNFTEQYILGEIYAQGLEAAGYDVSTDLNLGSEQVALKALENGEISGYPEYTSTALTSFFEAAPEDVPSDAQEAYEQSQADFEDLGLVAYPPTPFSSANAVGLLSSTAEELGVSTISDLEG